jgi:hypothetical protein
MSIYNNISKYSHTHYVRRDIYTMCFNVTLYNVIISTSTTVARCTCASQSVEKVRDALSARLGVTENRDTAEIKRQNEGQNESQKYRVALPYRKIIQFLIIQ